jgi:protein SCO1
MRATQTGMSRALRAWPVIAAAIGSCLVGSCGQAARAPASPPAMLGTQLDAAVPRALLDLPLTNQAGRPVTLRSFHGKVVVLNDLTTLCQETCAIGTASMLQAARAVDRAGMTDNIEFLSITIDPGRDDRRHLAAYRRLFGPLPNWELLRGSPASINKLWDTLGIWRRTVKLSPPYPRDWLTHRPLTVDIQHTDDLVFIGPQQRFRFVIDGPGSVRSASALPSRIYSFMDRSGHRNVSNPSAGSWTGSQVLRVLHWLVGAGGQQ